jgi:hypothetical protein
MVARSDVLMTVWDGRPAAGHGGAPEVIEFALAARRAVVWIDAAQDRPATRLTALSPTVPTGRESRVRDSA